jgi:hypothetical protein
MWIWKASTLNLEPLTDAYVDYCIGNCQELLRTWKREKESWDWDYPLYALRQFAATAHLHKSYRLRDIEKAYLADAIQFLESNSIGLWEDYKDNLEYKKALRSSRRWIIGCKRSGYRSPPRNEQELDHTFAALECFMMLEEKDLLNNVHLPHPL